MKSDILENYLSRFSKSKDLDEKDSIIAELENLVANETPDERQEGVLSIKKAVDKIATIIEEKHLHLTH
jgi:hypothetical protein